MSTLIVIFDWFYVRILFPFVQYLKSLFIRFKSTTTGQHNPRYENIISLTFYYAWHVITRKIDVNSDVQKKVLNSERVTKAIEKVAKEELLRKRLTNGLVTQDHQYQALSSKDMMMNSEYQQMIKKNRHQSFEHLMRLRSCISSSLLRIAGWILYRLLSRMFSSIQFSKVQIEQIRKKGINSKNNDDNNNIPILYLPLHRSTLDCILISFILSMNDLNPPLIAVSDNFLIPFFGNLMRGLGAFFVKRRNENEPDDSNDQIYQAILQSYIIENLREGNSMEFFIEEMRTCTGKVLMPNLGLLSIVLDALAEGSVQQVCVVPVSISYEKLVEAQEFVDEQLGQSKKRETFTSILKAIWSTLRSNYGTVRVDFGKPFIMNEYVNQIIVQKKLQSKLLQQQQNENNNKDNSGMVELDDFNDNCVACFHTRAKNQINNKNNNFINDDYNNDNNNIKSNTKTTTTTIGKKNIELLKIVNQQERYECIDALAKHVLHDVYRDSALMSTHLVSFILLNKYKKKGTTIDQLANDIDWLRQTICRDKQQNLSVLGDSFSLIRQALQFLGEDLIVTEKVRLKWSSWNNNRWFNNSYVSRNKNTCNNNSFYQWNNNYSNNNNHHNHNHNNVNNNNNDYNNHYHPDAEKTDPKSSKIEIIYLKPTCKLQSVLQLHHYSNSCAALFQFESVFAMSLFSFVNAEFSSLVYDPSTIVSNLSINKDEFMNRCKTICSILQKEFIFTKSCQSLDQVLEKTFEHSFVKRDVFVLNPNKPTGITLPMSDVNHHHYHHYQLIRNRRLASSRRCYFKLEGSLQNECILEVDENGLDNDDDDGDNRNPVLEFYIRLTEKNVQLLSLYRSIMEPYMQAYWLVADRLASMIKEPNQIEFIQEESFLKNLIQISKQLANNGSIHYECTSIQTFKNALEYFGSIGAVKRRKYEPKQRVNYTTLPTNATCTSSSSPLSTNTVSSTSLDDQQRLSSNATFSCLFDKQQMLALAHSIKNFVKLQ